MQFLFFKNRTHQGSSTFYLSLANGNWSRSKNLASSPGKVGHINIFTNNPIFKIYLFARI
jgi:hypothetical protein